MECRRWVKKGLVLAVAILGASTLTACSGASSKGEGGSEVLKVGLLPLTVGVPAQYAADKGWFEEEGLNVSLQYFATGAPVNEAIAADELDIACSGFASIYSLANADCVWLADVNTTGGMGIYARKESPVLAAGNTLSDLPNVYGSQESLKVLQILEPLGTAAQYMTESYGEKFGLTPNDIKQVNMEWASAFQAFQTGEGDLAAMNPPYSYQMEELGFAKVCSFEDVTGVNMCDGAFARGEIVKDRPEEVKKFVKCIVRAMDDLQDTELRKQYTIEFYKKNGQDFSEGDLTKEIIDRDYVGKDFMSKDGYKLGEAWVAITDFLVRAEKITAENAPNVEKAINTEIISEATGLKIK